MSITIEQLQRSINDTRAQEQAHIRDANACAGAAQAYEQLLSQLIQVQRHEEAKTKLLAGDKPPSVAETLTGKGKKKAK